MKQFFIFFLAITFFSCNSDDDSPSNQFDLLLGDWLRKELTIDGDNQLDPDSCDFILIFDDSFATIEIYSGDDCDQLTSNSGVYSVQNSNLSISLEGDIYGGEIITLTETSLILESVNNGNGAVQRTTFTKQ
jgi:hypothetical protein